jgi:Tol biopolymer transport system component
MTERDLTIRRHLSAAIDDLPIDVEERLSELRRGDRPPTPQHRLAATVVALAVAVVGIAFAGRAFLGSSGSVGSGGHAQPILFERVEAHPEDPAYFRTRIWSVREDGTHAGPLPQPSGNNTKAVWSPGGDRIAFVGSDPADEYPTLWVMKADGSALMALTDEFGVDLPSWSPDGTQIAFMGQRHPDPTGESDGPIGIWVVSASGGEPRLVLEGQDWEAPSWSPDGTRLAVTRRDGDVIDLSEGGISNIYTIGIDGSGLTRLTNDGAYYYGPEWSPDGTKIVCSRSLTENRHLNLDVYVMDADGSNLEQLTSWTGWDAGPTWSPDGDEILFGSDRGATPEELRTEGLGGVQGLAIYVMDADGGHVRLVFDDGAMQDSPTSWRP